MQEQLAIRPADDTDSGQVAALIATCWAAYPGCLLDIRGEEPILRAVASGFLAKRGRFWVACEANWIVGCVGVAPTPNGYADAELLKMYVHPRRRRLGLARRLEQKALAQAKEWDATTLDLWSDTRFLEAHAFYKAMGYRHTGKIRKLEDLSCTSEFHFLRNLNSPLKKVLIPGFYPLANQTAAK